MRFLGFFGLLENEKKSNHQKCENFIKRPYFFIAAFERRVLNSFFGPSEPSRKFFFSRHQDADSSKFQFFAKKHWKNNVFSFFGIPKIHKLWFSIGFSAKMKWDKIRKNKFYIKTNRKLQFLRFLKTQNPKIMIFQWFLIKN